MASLRSLSVSAAFAVLLPLQTLAAFTSPGALVMAWMGDHTARDFTFEAHAQIEGYYFSLWAKGGYQGIWPENGSAVESITFDVAAPAEGVKARVKAEFLLKDSVLYAKLVSAEGTIDQAMTELSASLKMKEWVAIPLEESVMAMMEENGMSPEEQKQMIATMYDAIFTMNAIPRSWGTEYQLMLKRDFLRQLMTAMSDVSPNMSMHDDQELQSLERMILQHLKLDVKLTVDTKDLSLGTAVSGTFNMPKENINVTFAATTSRRKTPLIVNAPAMSLPLEAFIESIDGSDLSGMDSFMPPMLDPFSTFDGGMMPHLGNNDLWKSTQEGPDFMEEWSESTSTSCPLGDMRKGLCGERPLRNR
jgi:hypothetical protein